MQALRATDKLQYAGLQLEEVMHEGQLAAELLHVKLLGAALRAVKR